MSKLQKQGRQYILPQNILQDMINMYDSKYSTTQIAEKYTINIKTVVKILKKNNVVINSHKYRKYIFNERFFQFIDTEEKAYWFGFLLADGSVDKNRGRITLALAEVDKTHIEKFQNAIGVKNSLTYNQKTKSYRLVLNSLPMKEDLMQIGCVDNKSYKDIRVPVLGNVESYRHFLRGIFDGDGCVTYNENDNRYKVEFIGSPRLIDFINSFLPLILGISTMTITRDARFKSDFTKCVAWGGKQNVLSILEFLYDNSSTKLNRKYEKYLLIDKSDVRNRKKTGLYAIAQRGRNIVGGKRQDVKRSKTEQRFETSYSEKSNCLTSVQKDSLLLDINNDYSVRKLTVNECCSLQGFPQNYCSSVSNSQGYKALGNSFTVPVIKHLLSKIINFNK